MLHVAHLSKHFGDLAVFEDFDLMLPQNGFTVLIGPSGCGKSTLFNVLTGVVAADGGEISWHGKTVSHLREISAYMQQKDLLLPWFSLMENALLPVRVGAAEKAHAGDKAAALFKRLGLEGFESYLPGKISGGMRQRCALVSTLMFERELAITRRSLQALLLMLQEDFAKSILMITHDIEEALRLADEILVLSERPMRILDHFSLQGPKLRRLDDPQLIEIKEYVIDLLLKAASN